MGQKQGDYRQAIRAAARAARRAQTPAERAVWEMLRDHRCGGEHFRRQVIVGPFRLDFYCARLRLAVEVDGGIHEEPDVIRRDADRQAILEHDKHIRFLRVTNEEVLSHPEQAKQRLLDALQATCQEPPLLPSEPSPLPRGEGRVGASPLEP